MNSEVFNQIISQVVSLFLIIIIGIFASKKKIITTEINKGLTSILLKVTMPLYIIYSFNIEYTNNVIKAFYYSLIAFIITIIIAYLFLSFIKSDKKNVLQFGLVFSNCGFMGFPIIGSIFGKEGVVYTSIFNMIFIIFVWTYGTMLYQDKISWKEVKKLFYNPGIIAVYIGLPIMIFNIKLPVFVLDSINIVGSMTVPISMLIIGFILSKVKLKTLFSHKTILYGSFIKLIIIPLFLLGISILLGIKSLVLTTIILLQAMPVGAMNSIFAENYEKHQEFAAIYVFISTLLSILTIPIILYLIQTLG